MLSLHESSAGMASHLRNKFNLISSTDMVLAPPSRRDLRNCIRFTAERH